MPRGGRRAPPPDDHAEVRSVMAFLQDPECTLLSYGPGATALTREDARKLLAHTFTGSADEALGELFVLNQTGQRFASIDALIGACVAHRCEFLDARDRALAEAEARDANTAAARRRREAAAQERARRALEEEARTRAATERAAATEAAQLRRRRRKQRAAARARKASDESMSAAAAKAAQRIDDPEAELSESDEGSDTEGAIVRVAHDKRRLLHWLRSEECLVFPDMDERDHDKLLDDDFVDALFEGEAGDATLTHLVALADNGFCYSLPAALATNPARRAYYVAALTVAAGACHQRCDDLRANTLRYVSRLSDATAAVDGPPLVRSPSERLLADARRTVAAAQSPTAAARLRRHQAAEELAAAPRGPLARIAAGDTAAGPGLLVRNAELTPWHLRRLFGRRTVRECVHRAYWLMYMADRNRVFASFTALRRALSSWEVLLARHCALSGGNTPYTGHGGSSSEDDSSGEGGGANGDDDDDDGSVLSMRRETARALRRLPLDTLTMPECGSAALEALTAVSAGEHELVAAAAQQAVMERRVRGGERVGYSSESVVSLHASASLALLRSSASASALRASASARSLQSSDAAAAVARVHRRPGEADSDFEARQVGAVLARARAKKDLDAQLSALNAVRDRLLAAQAACPEPPAARLQGSGERVAGLPGGEGAPDFFARQLESVNRQIAQLRFSTLVS